MITHIVSDWLFSPCCVEHQDEFIFERVAVAYSRDYNEVGRAQIKHEFRINRMVTDSDRTSNGRLYPFCPVESFEHVQNFPPDGTDMNGHHRTRNGFTGLETDIKRIRTDTNGCKKVLSVTHPLARCDRNLILV